MDACAWHTLRNIRSVAATQDFRHFTLTRQHSQIDALDLDVSPVAYLAKMFPGQSEQAYRARKCKINELASGQR